MKCVEVEREIYLLADDELDSAREEVKIHLRSCPACRQIRQGLRKLDEVLAASPVPPELSRLDNSVMTAFRRHHEKKAKVNESSTWWTIFTRHGFFPKLSTALTAASFALLIGLAFLVGRLTATDIQVSVPRAENVVFAPPQSDVSTATGESEATSNQTPLTRFVKVPVTKERIVTRLIYINKPEKTEKPERKINPAVVIGSNKPASQSVEKQNELTTEANLKGFQPVSDSTIRIIKRGENNEN